MTDSYSLHGSHSVLNDLDRIDRDESDIHSTLKNRRQIAVIWSVDDVLEIRPDLTEDEAWDVLQAVEDDHDANLGICWDVLEYHATCLFGPETDHS
jgi:hypothetical protein